MASRCRRSARVILGARSAVFAPVSNLGLIVIDEEQESAYKQEEAPRYHAREVAKARVEREGGLLLLGSATPSLESFHAALNGEYELLRLPSRVENKPLPRVTVVDMREELRAGNRTMFSRELQMALHTCLAGKSKLCFEPSRLCLICALPRIATLKCATARFRSPFASRRPVLSLLCLHSEIVPRCPNAAVPTRPWCRHAKSGTGRRRLFPHARVLRMDVDTTVEGSSRSHLESILQRAG